MSQNYHKAWMVCLATAFASGFPTAASAGMAKTTWTAYMYEGPGYRYSVVDEVPEASDLDLGRCDSGWCRVRYGDRVGYIRAEIVTSDSLANPASGVFPQPAANVSGSRPSGPCVDANQTGGNGGNALTRFCQK